MPPAETKQEIDDLVGKLTLQIYRSDYDLEGYIVLYGNKEHIALMIKIAPGFFGPFIQGTLLESFKLGLVRIFDPSSTGVNGNATLPRLSLLLKNHDPDFHRGVDSIIATLSSRMEPLRQERNKAIAHLDLDYIMGKRLLPDGLALSEYREIITEVKDLLRRVSSELGLSKGNFTWPPTGNPAFEDIRALTDRLKVIDGLEEAELLERLLAVRRRENIPKP